MSDFWDVSWGIESATATSHPGNLAVPLCSSPAGGEGAEVVEAVTLPASQVLQGLPSAPFQVRKFTSFSERKVKSQRVEQGGANTKNPGA